jgi:hypothetical protein
MKHPVLHRGVTVPPINLLNVDQVAYLATHYTHLIHTGEKHESISDHQSRSERPGRTGR